jgi:hypothetical protein
MTYDPATMPALDACLRRGVFRSHIFRRPLDILFRGDYYVAAKSEPSLQRKVNVAGYTQETADLEIMLALPTGTTKPETNSSDEVVVYEPRSGDPTAVRASKSYRITNVQTDIAPDCYQLTLTLRRP